MYSKLGIASRYLKYFVSAANGKGHGVHSPFVYKFIREVLNDRKHYPAYEKVEGLRRQLLQDHQVIRVEDLGAGSSIQGTLISRKVSAITKNAAKPARIAKLLHRITKYYQPGTVIELGTSMGISTAYLSMGTDGKVFTIEGSEEVRAVAMRNFKSLELENIISIGGNFDDRLPQLLSETNQVDLAFIDGNHRFQPTTGYFEMLLEKSHNDTMLIFDDIHWSEEMEKAWEQIRNDERVRCSIDLFFLGIVVFRNEFREKVDFTIRW